MRSVDRSCGEARQGKYEESQSSKVGYAAPDLDVASPAAGFAACGIVPASATPDGARH